MNQNFNQLQVRFPGLGCWVFVLISFWVIGAVGITGILKSIFALVLFVVLAPVLAFLGLQFWVKRNLVEGNCPVCEQPLTGLKSVKTPCPNCGTEVTATADGFERAMTDGVIDVQAVDTNASTVMDESADDDVPFIETTVVDVDVQQLPEG